MGAPLLEWAASGRPLPGQDVSGDRAIVNVEGGLALAAAVDGLGHGPDAAVAADRAVSAIGTSADPDVATLARRCHEVLAPTRGAAISVASLDAASASLTWLGIGNVEGRIVRSRHANGGHRDESLLLAPGVVGHELPALRPSTLRLGRGDLLLLATDGVDPGFADSLPPAGSCRAIADRVLEQHARASDDALVLVVRYLGEGR